MPIRETALALNGVTQEVSINIAGDVVEDTRLSTEEINSMIEVMWIRQHRMSCTIA